MRRHALAVTLLCLFAVQVGVSGPVRAETTTFIGCLECYERTVLTIPRDSCVQVGDHEEGWTQCMEETYGTYRLCSLAGSACFNVEAGGGSGSGSGGGSGGSCVVGPSSPCPAECFSCERDPNRI
jgi:hypothetical protein